MTIIVKLSTKVSSTYECTGVIKHIYNVNTKKYIKKIYRENKSLFSYHCKIWAVCTKVSKYTKICNYKKMIFL